MTENVFEFALAQPDQVVLETGDEALPTQDQRHPLAGRALDRLAIARALEADHSVVVGRRATTLDGHQRGLLVAQLLDDLVDQFVVDRVDRDLEGIVAVGTQLYLGPHGQGDAIRRALAFGE